MWDGNLKEDRTSIEHPEDAVTGAMRWVILFVTALSLTHESRDRLAAMPLITVGRFHFQGYAAFHSDVYKLHHLLFLLLSIRLNTFFCLSW